MMLYYIYVCAIYSYNRFVIFEYNMSFIVIVVVEQYENVIAYNGVYICIYYILLYIQYIHNGLYIHT